MEQQDELEIETRLRAALQARSELVTHSTLRPGIPPNEHTAGVRSGRQTWWSWRRLWVPVTVAAALAGGVFAGAQLNSGSNGNTTSAATGAGTGNTATPGNGTSSGSPSPKNAVAAGNAVAVGTVSLTVADGWQLTTLSATSGCVTLKDRPAPVPAASSNAAEAALPCGVDGLYVKTDAAPGAWPLSTADSAAGWWPGQTASPSGLACPAVQPTSSNRVKASELLRSTAKYTLAANITADFREWAVTCDTGSGVQPMLWKLHPAAGFPAPAGFTVAAVVSADPQYESALLSMVGSLHQAS